MEFEEVITKRCSTRHYTPDLVPMETVKEILDAGRRAPSWANMQGVRYVVVQEKQIVDEISTIIGQKWTREKTIPMYIVAYIKEEGSGTNSNGLKYFMVDVGIAFEHVILAATDKGLGTCWIGHFDELAIKKVLSIPDRFRVVAITPLGHPAKECKQATRIPLEKLASVDRYKNPLP